MGIYGDTKTAKDRLTPTRRAKGIFAKQKKTIASKMGGSYNKALNKDYKSEDNFSTRKGE